MRRLLIIEDDHMLVESLTRFLDGLEIEVVHVTNFTDASAALTYTDFNWVLSDWDLGIYDTKNGGEIVSALMVEFPCKYIIWSGLDREVPEGVDFVLKSGIADLIAILDPE